MLMALVLLDVAWRAGYCLHVRLWWIPLWLCRHLTLQAGNIILSSPPLPTGGFLFSQERQTLCGAQLSFFFFFLKPLELNRISNEGTICSNQPLICSAAHVYLI